MRSKADVSFEGRHRGESRVHWHGSGDLAAHQREVGGNGSGLAGVAVTGPFHRGATGEGRTAAILRGTWDPGLARDGGPDGATGLTARLVLVYLRLAVGIPELVESLEKFQHLPRFVALWHRIHLPAAEILAPAYAGAELLGALLLLAGWRTRTVAALFVVQLLSEILLTKHPLLKLGAWMVEWQSLVVVLILAQVGAGPWSLDWHAVGRRARHSVAKRFYQEAWGHDPPKYG